MGKRLQSSSPWSFPDQDPSTTEDISMKEETFCQAFSDALLCKIEDIDSEDNENPQLCSDYVKDIYQYLRQLEVPLSVCMVVVSACPDRPLVVHLTLRIPCTGCAVHQPTFLRWQRHQRAHACHPGGLAGAGARKVPAAAGDAVHVCRHHGSLSSGKWNLQWGSAAGLGYKAGVGHPNKRA